MVEGMAPRAAGGAYTDTFEIDGTEGAVMGVQGMAPRAAGGRLTIPSKSMGPKAPLWGSKAWLPGPPGDSTPIPSRLRWSKGLSMGPGGAVMEAYTVGVDGTRS